MLKMLQLSLQFIFKIMQPLQGWSLLIQNSPHPLAPVKLLLPDFPLNSLTHFPLVSFPLSASHIIVFHGILSSAVFSQLLFSWGDLTHVYGSTTTKCLSSVPTEPLSSQTCTSNSLPPISIGLSLKQLKISTSTPKSPSLLKSPSVYPFLVNGITVESFVQVRNHLLFLPHFFPPILHRHPIHHYLPATVLSSWI